MSGVTYDHVWKKYGDFVALKDLTLEIADKEFLVLVGPSGCGKTTALRCLAGLEEISQGTISIGDRVVNDIPPKDRDIAMVFQSYALYPHMSVYDNMAFGLKLRKTPEAEIKKRVDQAAQVLGIEQLMKRKPRELSGGQRQRVAVGRAIVREPKVFLFDEPLSNLDAKLRVQMRTEISKLHHRLQNTFIYVTHDQTEAMTMATRIAVMNKGLLLQVDTPQMLYDHPANQFVAGFIGSPSMNFFPVHLRKDGNALYVDGGTFALRVPEGRTEALMPHAGKHLIFGVRPENIHNPQFVPAGIHAEPMEARVEVTELMGNEIFLYLLNGSNNFVARVDPRTREEIGASTRVMIDMDSFHLFDPTQDQENPPALL